MHWFSLGRCSGSVTGYQTRAPPSWFNLHSTKVSDKVSDKERKILKYDPNPYFARFGLFPELIEVPPEDPLRLVVVIPCHDEPDLLAALRSLHACKLPANAAVEVIVVINASRQASAEVQRRNVFTFQQASRWAAGSSTRGLKFFVFHFPDLPPKTAGVGLARKIGLDEGVRRFQRTGTLEQGILACYDADCSCEPNYLVALIEHFRNNPQTPGCSIYFEHALDTASSETHREAITLYELHLRYYRQALRQAQFPYAFHTVGSAMAVRPEVYCKQGGMNQRKAGEDFYFLNKIFPVGGFTDLTATRVIASPRASHRVPFGTGKAVQRALAGEVQTTYPWEGFADLRALFGSESILWEQPFSASPIARQLSRPLQAFLEGCDFQRGVGQLAANTGSPAAFRKRFFQWFNGFLVMKYLNYAGAHYGEPLVSNEAVRFLAMVDPDQPRPESSGEALERFRVLDRQGPALHRGTRFG